MTALRLTRTLEGVVSVGLTLVTAANALAAGYLGVITAAGARRPSPPAGGTDPKTHFAILVPAHDEEAVIADTLLAFQQLDYDPNLFEVHVVADNCTDRTGEIVLSCGWTVHERSAADDPGKGPALNWLFDRLDRVSTGRFDAAVIVDADTVVDPGFLRAMDRAFADGAVAAQGFYSVRDPDDSASAGLRYVALACRHYLRPLGRCRLGASSGLYGNGMAFEWSILRRRRWTGHLVEDAEFQMDLLLQDGVIVTFVPHARLEAEMPSSLEAASSQNERWERGRVDLAKRYLPALAREIANAPANRRLAYADAIADHLVPPLSVLAALQVLAVTGNVAASVAGNTSSRTRARVDLLATAATLTHVVTGLRSVEAPASAYRSLVQIPKMIVWKVRLWAGALRPTNEVTWQRTQRNAER